MLLAAGVSMRRQVLQDPKIPSVKPDEILNNVLGVVAAARGFSDDGLRSIARRIMMELCR